jgi:hypothetical protein
LLVRPGFRQSGLRRRHGWATDKAAISDNIGSVNSVASGLRFATISGERTRIECK